MKPVPIRCLVLACGNTLRSDDGVGPWLAAWAEERFSTESRIKTTSRQQWTPELAEDLAHAQSAIFIDCSTASSPGSIDLVPVVPAASSAGLATHHLGAPELLALTRELYSSAPQRAIILTIGAGSIELGEQFTDEVKSALPAACNLLEETALDFLSD